MLPWLSPVCRYARVPLGIRARKHQAKVSDIGTLATKDGVLMSICIAEDAVCGLWSVTPSAAFPVRNGAALCFSLSSFCDKNESTQWTLDYCHRG